MPPSQVATGPAHRVVPPASHLFAVAAGGAIGALARVGLTTAFPATAGRWPVTTFLENVSGAFALALVLTLLAERVAVPPQVRLGVCTGALGAFTTYSTFAGEVVTDLLADRWLLASGYAVSSLVAGLLAAVAGARLARVVDRRRGRP